MRLHFSVDFGFQVHVTFQLGHTTRFLSVFCIFYSLVLQLKFDFLKFLLLIVSHQL